MVGGITSEAEERALEEANAWVTSIGLKPGVMSYEQSDAATGAAVAILDLAWPNGVQEGLTAPVALLLDEGEATIASASAAGFRCFTTVEELKTYIERDVMGQGVVEPAE